MHTVCNQTNRHISVHNSTKKLRRTKLKVDNVKGFVILLAAALGYCGEECVTVGRNSSMCKHEQRSKAGNVRVT